MQRRHAGHRIIGCCKVQASTKRDLAHRAEAIAWAAHTGVYQASSPHSHTRPAARLIQGGWLCVKHQSSHETTKQGQHTHCGRTQPIHLCRCIPETSPMKSLDGGMVAAVR